jgi:DNA-binding transcriptional LysR family regulator
MDLQDFTIFARVAAVQNLSAVGHELGLTPGTISKRLQALEDDLNARLFDRTTRSIRITPEGQTFLAHVERILADVEKAKASVGDYTVRPRGELRICAPTSLGRYELAPAISAFLRRYPEIDVRVELSDRVGRRLLDEGYDLAIRIGDMADSALITKRIGSLPQMLSASPRYIDERGAPQVPADLARHDCLAVTDTSHWTFVDLSVSRAEPKAVTVQGRLRSNSAALLHRAALVGHGIFRSSQSWVRKDIERGDLVPVLEGYRVADDVGIYVVYSGTRYISPRLRAMLDFLAQRFRAPAREKPRAGAKTLLFAAK